MARVSADPVGISAQVGLGRAYVQAADPAKANPAGFRKALSGNRGIWATWRAHERVIDRPRCSRAFSAASADPPAAVARAKALTVTPVFPRARLEGVGGGGLCR